MISCNGVAAWEESQKESWRYSYQLLLCYGGFCCWNSPGCHFYDHTRPILSKATLMTPVTNDALDLPVHYWIGLDIPSRRTCFGVTTLPLRASSAKTMTCRVYRCCVTIHTVKPTDMARG